MSTKQNCKGQMLVFYALVLPIMFVFVGMAADFGWLYLNQSRLQNAADAAVTAGAKKLIADEQSLSDYNYATFIANSDEGLQRLIEEGVVSSRKGTERFKIGDAVAQQYAADNLGQLKDNVITDSWNSGTNNVVDFETKLYGYDTDDYDALYYTVTLTENLTHLFSIMEGFEGADLMAKATAVAKITHVMQPSGGGGEEGTGYEHGVSLYTTLVALRNKVSYATWDHIKNEYSKMNSSEYKDILGVTSADNAARARSVQSKGNVYLAGNRYRTETLGLHGYSIAMSTYGNTQSGAKVMDQRKLDNLFVDFKVDIVYNYKSNGDRDLTDPDNPADAGKKTLSGATYKSGYNLDANNKHTEDGVNYRIHSLINVGRWDGSKYVYEYKVREDKEAPDPLYVYIENENAYGHQYQSSNNTSNNTVRQIIINVNVANTASDDRPMVFFYDGPEKIDGMSTDTWNENWRESWKDDSQYADNPRNSQPVILNLNADFRGILFMPNSPVVINGNGHKFEGLIVAQNYLQLKTAADFPEEATFNGGVVGVKTIDDNGNVVYVRKEEESTEPTESSESTEPEVLYTYTLITQEKSGLPSTFVGYEKEYVDVYPMFIDQIGNVQYKSLGDDYIDSSTPTPNDPGWLEEFSGDNYQTNKQYEVIYKKSVFNLSSVKFNSYKKFFPIDYTYLNSSDADVFYTAQRSTWIN